MGFPTTAKLVLQLRKPPPAVLSTLRTGIANTLSDTPVGERSKSTVVYDEGNLMRD